MESLLPEKEVLSQLGIPDFRHLSKDKVMSFASMIPKMEPEVAKKALEQFPDFSKMSLEGFKDYKNVLTKALDENSSNSKRVMDMYDKVLDALKICLTKENLPFEEKQYYIAQMREVAEEASKKDTENKFFNSKVVTFATAALGILVLAGASALGGNTNIKLPDKK